MKRPRSLQVRLLLLALAVVSAAWIGAAAVAGVGTRHELDELLDSHLAQAAALLVARQLHPEDGEAGVDAPMLHRYAPRVAFQVWHGRALALRSSNAPAVPMARHAQGFADQVLDGRHWRVFAAQGAEGDVQVYVGESLAARHEILLATLRGALMPLLLALPLLALLVAWAVRRGLAPLRQLATLLARRRPQALEPVTLASPGSELQTLVDALNALLARTAALLESERRFTADAAHELRTPLAALRAQAEVALCAADDVSRRHALRGTLEGCDRAAHLVEQLLMLARLEAQGAPPLQAVDLAAMARRVLAQLAPQALAKRQDLALQAPAHFRAVGDEVLLAALLRNLVDNAVRYSPAGARIVVQLDPGRLQVDDSGPGLPPGQRARLGDRFYRAAGSGESGSGLGWSIVCRIAQVHGLSVYAEPSPLGGLRVVVDGFSPAAAVPAAEAGRVLAVQG